MRILITGVDGQDGLTMTEYLLKNTLHEIYGGTRRNHTDTERLKFISLDLTDEKSVIHAISTIKPDYCFNFAAQSSVAESWNSPQLTFEVNTLGVLRLLEAIKNYASECRFFSSGSSEERNPKNPYGISKNSAQQLVKLYREKYKLYAVHCVLFNHEGIFRGGEFVTRKITKNIARIKHQINTNQELTCFELGNIFTQRDWSDAEDIIDGIWKIVNQPSPKEYVLSSDKLHTVKEFIDLACSHAELNVNWEIDTEIPENTTLYYKTHPIIKISKKLFRPTDQSIVGDSSEARIDLGWKPQTDFSELIKKMIINDMKN